MAQGTVDTIHVSVCLQWAKGMLELVALVSLKSSGIDGTKVRGRIERLICADESQASVFAVLRLCSCSM